jgi:Na+(H+)/acetate symporter ActP
VWVFRVIGVLVALILGGLAFTAAYFLSGPLVDWLFRSSAGTQPAATLILAVPLLLSAFLGGLLAGIGGGLFARAMGLIGGLIIALTVLVVSTLIAPVRVDANLAFVQQLIPLLGPVVLTIFAAWIGEVIATVLTEPLTEKMERRERVESLRSVIDRRA